MRESELKLESAVLKLSLMQHGMFEQKTK